MKSVEEKSIRDEFGVDADTLKRIFNDGFWYKPTNLFISGEELDRFKYKNSDFYDEENDLFFEPGLNLSTDNVIYPVATLSATVIDGNNVYFLSTGIGCVELSKFKTDWSFDKEDLIKKES